MFMYSEKFLRSEPPGYAKALKEFNVLFLIEQLAEAAPDSPDTLTELAALLILHLANGLPLDWLSTYHHAVRRGQTQQLQRLLQMSRPLPLPADAPSFFLEAKPPYFPIGTVVRWLPLDDFMPPDWGVVIGRFYGYAPERCRWLWCYVILLDPDAPSARWCGVDTAWENDLEAEVDE
ncbi:MAG: hypothetical protein F6K03_07780 [Kamptonema sp. SIO4C4]|nr:hypothetical protein [Kamptonema sp. SIO4C4]